MSWSFMRVVEVRDSSDKNSFDTHMVAPTRKSLVQTL